MHFSRRCARCRSKRRKSRKSGWRSKRSKDSSKHLERDTQSSGRRSRFCRIRSMNAPSRRTVLGSYWMALEARNRSGSFATEWLIKDSLLYKAMYYWALHLSHTSALFLRSSVKRRAKNGPISLLSRKYWYRIAFLSLKYLESPSKSKSGTSMDYLAINFQSKMLLYLKSPSNKLFALTLNTRQTNG